MPSAANGGPGIVSAGPNRHNLPQLKLLFRGLLDRRLIESVARLRFGNRGKVENGARVDLGEWVELAYDIARNEIDHETHR